MVVPPLIGCSRSLPFHLLSSRQGQKKKKDLKIFSENLRADVDRFTRVSRCWASQDEGQGLQHQAEILLSHTSNKGSRWSSERFQVLILQEDLRFPRLNPKVLQVHLDSRSSR